MRPNILLILADEQPSRRVSCYGSDEVCTPNLDRLAAGGVRFEHAYTCSPTCPPEFLVRHEGKDYPLPETFGRFPADRPPWLLREMPEDFIRRVTRLTAACAEFVDDEIGRVMRAAAAHGPTCTVYTTDHGNQLGAHSLMFKGSFMYEESCRIPNGDHV